MRMQILVELDLQRFYPSTIQHLLRQKCMIVDLEGEKHRHRQRSGTSTNSTSRAW